MPKFAIALISAALAGVVGFLLGALFTVPQNKEMEDLINSKERLSQEVQTLETELKNLNNSNTTLEEQVVRLKDKLLKAYEIEKEASIF